MRIEDLKKEIVDGKAVLALESRRIPEETIIVPSRIEYPDLRRAFPSGTFIPGDIVVVSVQIYDSDGNDKTPPDFAFKLPLDIYTEDEAKEVLGVLYFNFVESNKSRNVAIEPEPITDDIVADIAEDGIGDSEDIEDVGNINSVKDAKNIIMAK